MFGRGWGSTAPSRCGGVGRSSRSSVTRSTSVTSSRGLVGRDAARSSTSRLALLADPAVLLLDEPYQGFDRGTYVNFWDHCQRWRDQGKAVLVVTHMLAELDRVDRVVELPAHPSRPDASGER